MESFGEKDRGRRGKGKKKKEKWFGPFPSLNVFSNSCVQFPRFLRPRNVPYLSVECSCTMRVSSKRMAMAMHVFILLLHLTYYHVSFFLRLFKKTIEKIFLRTIFVSNLWKFHDIIKINWYKMSFLVRIIHKISSKSKLYDLLNHF